MYGVWWAGAEPDVEGRGRGRQGLQRAWRMQHGAEPKSKVVKDILTMVHDKGQGTGPKDEVGQVLYMRGAMSRRCWAWKACARAQERFGKGKVMTGEQVRWGLENLDAGPEEARRAGLCRRDAAHQHHPASTTWVPPGRASTPGDGKDWKFTPDWYAGG